MSTNGLSSGSLIGVVACLSTAGIAVIFTLIQIARYYARGRDGMTGPERVELFRVSRIENRRLLALEKQKPMLWDICVDPESVGLESEKEKNDLNNWGKIQPLSISIIRQSHQGLRPVSDLQIATIICMPNSNTHHDISQVAPVTTIAKAHPTHIIHERPMNYNIGVHRALSVCLPLLAPNR